MHQSLNGGMFTVGGATAFVLTPEILSLTGWFGIHAVGGVIAIPAIFLLWINYDSADYTRPDTRPKLETSPPALRQNRTSIVRNRIVLLAAVCNVATLGAYITLATFVTAYFSDIGISGPVNALALLLASFGRLGGGIAVVWPQIGDGRLIAAASGVGAFGLLSLPVGHGAVLIVGLTISLAAVSLPFGAVLKTAAGASSRDGTAVAVVVAAGNAAGLTLPAVTGWLRDITGGYDVAFLLLGSLNILAAVAGILIARRVS